jgi:hypothetical protein
MSAATRLAGYAPGGYAYDKGIGAALGPTKGGRFRLTESRGQVRGFASNLAYLTDREADACTGYPE